MNTLDIMLASLRIEEDLRLTPYRCTAKKLTIGYGHNIEAKPLKGDMANRLKQTGMITKEDAERLLAEDSMEAFDDAHSIVRNFDALSNNRQAVIAEMVFQMGRDGVKRFKHTIEAIERYAFELAAIEMLDSKWATQDSRARAKRYADRMRAG